MFKPIHALYQTDQVRALDRVAIEQFKILGFTLMQRAGQAAFELLQKRWPKSMLIQVLCGKGNNAGDGYVVAKLAFEAGLEVEIIYLADPMSLSGDALLAAKMCQKAGVTMRKFDSKEDLAGEVIIDALLGTGIKGEVTGEFRRAIDAVNQSEAMVLSIDLPSGLDADTGNALNIAVVADTTITFVAPKQGFFTGEAANYCGELFYDDLGVPIQVFDQIRCSSELIQLEEIKRVLSPRSRVAHKGCFGHVLIVGGDYGMAGAVAMAGEAAARCGAGLTTVATRPEHIVAVSGQRPELMCFGISSSDELVKLIERATVIVIGPGLGQSLWSENLFEVVMQTDKPKIIDADGLNLLAKHPAHSENWILTPHPGEAARLLDCSITEIQQDRFAAVRKLQQRFGGVVVLKGARTLVCGCDIGVCAAGNPGMASGGMGDVLSGILGGLLAQGVGFQDAARIGVLVHSKSADLAAENGGERGLLAMDLLPFVRNYLNLI